MTRTIEGFYRNGYGIYVHIPFCRSRCLYCAFYSSPAHKDKYNLYFEALKKEFLIRLPSIPKGATVRTLYFGGGTPSLPEPVFIADFIQFLSNQLGYRFRPEEITLEVNPENATPENVSVWTTAGITRFSMGVQSLIAEELKKIGRRHNAETVSRAASLLKKHGDLCMDLICGLPGQTLESFMRSLNGILDMRPDHLSVYLLELDQDSPLARMVKLNRISLPDEELVEKMYLTLCDRMKESGFEHYEISNFALPGHHSRHNSLYWDGTPYIGLGASAAGYPKFNHRYVNISDLYAYINDGPQSVEEILSPIEIMEEHILTRLRTYAGIDINKFKSLFGEAEASGLLLRSGNAITHGLLEVIGGHLRLKDKYACLLSDAIMVELMK